MNNLKHHKLALGCLFLLAILYVAAILAPYLSPYDFDKVELVKMSQAPSISHPFGTDGLGRDVATRIMYGGRISLFAGLSVAILSTLIGTIIGLVAGYYGGFIDNILMRLTDLALTIPMLPVLIVAGAFISGGTSTSIIVILSALLWMYIARVVRASCQSLKERDFVLAAKVIGASDLRIMTYHILPNLVGTIIVNATLTLGLAIMMESVLSFIGFGIQPPVPSWGNMLSEAQKDMVEQPWLVWAPGSFIVLSLVAINFLGDGLRDYLDPEGNK